MGLQLLGNVETPCVQEGGSQYHAYLPLIHKMLPEDDP